MAGELENAEIEGKTTKIPIFALLDINRSPLANDLDFSEFLELSFTHHMEILLKTSTLEERAFYIHQTFLRILTNVLSKIPLFKMSKISS